MGQDKVADRDDPVGGDTHCLYDANLAGGIDEGRQQQQQQLCATGCSKQRQAGFAQEGDRV